MDHGVVAKNPFHQCINVMYANVVRASLRHMVVYPASCAMISRSRAHGGCIAAHDHFLLETLFYF